MLNIHRLLWAATGILLLPLVTVAGQPLRWQPTLESAKRLALQTDRLVLIHFWSEGCRACRTMDLEVLSQPSVAQAIQGDFVPVKINADYFPTTCKQYGVTTLPTDIVITPQGQRVDGIRGPLAAFDYISRLNRVAAARRQPGAESYAQIPAGRPPVTAGQGYQPQNATGHQAASAERAANQGYADYYNRQRQPSGPEAYLPNQNRPPVDARAEQHLPPGQPAAPSRGAHSAPAAKDGPAPESPSGWRSSDNPHLGLDGYCPVQLSDDLTANLPRWTLGDRRWGAIHRGQTYLFAGAQQQQRFLANPDRYAPALSGNDVVMAVEHGQAVQGRREHGVLFSSQVYLFASEASLEKFSKNPHHYARQILQAMRAADNRTRQRL